MACLYILIDSSTSRTSKTNRYGKSSACWCVFRNELRGMPCRAGVVYREYEGPHKMFFSGVIQALKDCKCLFLNFNTVKIMGDDLTIIKILNGDWDGHELKLYHDQVKEIESNCNSKYGVEFKHEYISEDNIIYKAVDKIAKELRHNIPKKFSQKKAAKKVLRNSVR